MVRKDDDAGKLLSKKKQHNAKSGKLEPFEPICVCVCWPPFLPLFLLMVNEVIERFKLDLWEERC